MLFLNVQYHCSFLSVYAALHCSTCMIAEISIFFFSKIFSKFQNGPNNRILHTVRYITYMHICTYIVCDRIAVSCICLRMRKFTIRIQKELQQLRKKGNTEEGISIL